MDRTDLLNKIALATNAQTYLEIGVYDRDNFDKIVCPVKFGVDPSPATTNIENIYVASSHDWFRDIMTGRLSPIPHNTIVMGDMYNSVDTFDLVFIDGMHLSENVVEDFFMALSLLSPTGSIVFHDCLPEYEEQQEREHKGNWMGDVWKGIAYLGDMFNRCLFPVYQVDTGMAWFTNHLGMQTPYEMYNFVNSQGFYPPSEAKDMFKWEDYLKSKESILDIRTEENFVEQIALYDTMGALELPELP